MFAASSPVQPAADGRGARPSPSEQIEDGAVDELADGGDAGGGDDVDEVGPELVDQDGLGGALDAGRLADGGGDLVDGHAAAEAGEARPPVGRRRRAGEGDLADHDHEFDDVTWVPLDRALLSLSYENERHVLETAAKKLGALA